MAKDALFTGKFIRAECVRLIRQNCELCGLAACPSPPGCNRTLIGQHDLAPANGWAPRTGEWPWAVALYTRVQNWGRALLQAGGWRAEFSDVVCFFKLIHHTNTAFSHTQSLLGRQIIPFAWPWFASYCFVIFGRYSAKFNSLYWLLQLDFKCNGENFTICRFSGCYVWLVCVLALHC